MSAEERLRDIYTSLDIEMSRVNIPHSIDKDSDQIINLHLSLTNPEYQSILKIHGILKTLPNLRYLTISAIKYPSFPSLPDDTFNQLKSLQALDLRGLGVSSLQGCIFDNLIHLKYLTLAHNKLSTLHVDLFSELVNLKEFSLVEENIKTLPRGIFDNLINLEVLRLTCGSANDKFRLPSRIFDKFIKLHSLTIDRSIESLHRRIKGSIYILNSRPDVENEIDSFNFAMLEIENVARNEYDLRITSLRPVVLNIIQQISPNIPVQLSRIAGLSHCTEDEAEYILKSLTENRSELGQYLEFERVFIHKDVEVYNDSKFGSSNQSSEKDDKNLKDRIYAVIWDCSIGIPMQFNRIIELGKFQSLAKSDVEALLIEILLEQPDIGKYHEREQVFIRFEQKFEEEIHKSSTRVVTCVICAHEFNRSKLHETNECPKCNSRIEICIICNNSVQDNPHKAQCKHCLAPFHFSHLAAEIQARGLCPLCKESLQIQDIQ